MYRYSLIFLALVWSLNLFAQNDIEELKAFHYLNSRGEVYLRIDMQGANRKELAGHVSLDHKIEGQFQYAYANRKQFLYLIENQIPYTVSVPPSMQKEVRMASKKSDLASWDAYPTYEQYLELMNDWATNHPDLCNLHEIGESIEGRKILALKISDNPQAEEDEPNLFYSSSIHGDELVGYILMLRLIDYLLTNYNAVPIVTELLNNTEIWINPLANPDGTYAAGNSTVMGATRNNAATNLTSSNGQPGVDLNRNYPDPRSGNHPDGNEWQPENIAMMEFMKEQHFVLAANFHGGEEVVNYPWDTWWHYHADNDWYRYLSRLYVDSVHRYSPATYFDGFENGITNGAEWYVINGGRQDYQNYFLHGREVTIELSVDKLPAESKLPDFWNYNRQALLYYLQQGQYGVRGIVRDAVSAQPILAKIEILAHDADNSEVYTDFRNGNYHRFLAEGAYDVRISAEGYTSQTFYQVLVLNNQATWLNADLEPAPANNETLVDLYEARIFPNPLTEDSIVSFYLPKTQSVCLRVYNIAGLVCLQHSELLAPGEHSYSLSELSLPTGSYICDLQIGSYSKRIKVMVVK